MAIDIDTKHGKSLPPEITQSDSLPIKTHLPIKPSEFTFKRFYKKPKVKAFQECPTGSLSAPSVALVSSHSLMAKITTIGVPTTPL